MPGEPADATLELIDKEHVFSEGGGELILASSSTTWVLSDERRATNTIDLAASTLEIPTDGPGARGAGAAGADRACPAGAARARRSRAAGRSRSALPARARGKKLTVRVNGRRVRARVRGRRLTVRVPRGRAVIRVSGRKVKRRAPGAGLPPLTRSVASSPPFAQFSSSTSWMNTCTSSG